MFNSNLYHAFTDVFTFVFNNTFRNNGAYDFFKPHWKWVIKSQKRTIYCIPANFGGWPNMITRSVFQTFLVVISSKTFSSRDGYFLRLERVFCVSKALFIPSQMFISFPGAAVCVRSFQDIHFHSSKLDANLSSGPVLPADKSLNNHYFSSQCLLLGVINLDV